MSDKYILDGKIPVPCDDLLEWGRWLDTTANRIVRQEDIGPLFVSTVFLGLDHDFSGKGPPLLFETMIFRSATDDMDRREEDGAPMWRTSTWELALEQHEEAVAWARARNRETLS